MIRQRGRIIQWILISIFLFILLFIPTGEANLLWVLIEYSRYLFKPHRYQIELVPLYLLLITNLTLLILLFIKKINHIALKIFAIVQFALYIIISVVYINASWKFTDFYAVVFVIFILLSLSLLQIFNLFFSSPKSYKHASIISSSIVITLLLVYSVLFWTVSRFEFKLNDDGQSYSIVSINSDIHTIKIPSNYQGLPVTKINSNFYVYKNIHKTIFEEDSHIEVIERYAFRGSNIRKLTLPSSLHSIRDSAFFECNSLEQVIIPIEVIYMGSSVFYCPKATIYCEAEAKPGTWDDNWCYKAKEIIWGYGG